MTKKNILKVYNLNRKFHIWFKMNNTKVTNNVRVTLLLMTLSLARIKNINVAQIYCEWHGSIKQETLGVGLTLEPVKK